MISGSETAVDLNVRILIIEDEARDSLTEILALEGFDVIGFANGLDALVYVQKSEAPCLIILDLRMPVMDGRQFRAAQRRDPRVAAVPTVVVTAHDPSEAAGLAASRVLRKPIDLVVLLEVVRQYCRA